MNGTIERKPLVYTRREAAQLAKVGLDKVDEWIARRAFPARKDGRRVIIPAAAYERFLTGDDASAT